MTEQREKAGSMMAGDAPLTDMDGASDEPGHREHLLRRIALDPAIMTGKPVIRGTRLTVEHILALRAGGVTETDILDEYPGIRPEDLQACYLFAAKALADNAFVPLVETT